MDSVGLLERLACGYNRKIKFNPNSLSPFQHVLVRECRGDIWEVDIFSSYQEGTEHPFHCIGAWHNICIPYDGNESLAGTTKDCLDFWKTWE